VRSAVVLGLIGAGGLGYQLALSFSSLRWEQVWTTVYALATLCRVADVAGRAVRRRLGEAAPSGGASLSRDRVLTGAVAGSLLLVAWSWWYLALSPSTLLSSRTREQLGYVAGAGWPPELDGGLLPAIGSAAVETVQMSVIAIALAAGGAVALAGVAARPAGPSSAARRWTGVAVRLALLLLRAVQPPVWALALLFVFLPGVLPGALDWASTPLACWAGWSPQAPRRSAPGCTPRSRRSEGRPSRCRSTAGRWPSGTPCWWGCWAPVASACCSRGASRPSTGLR
jgi:phosphonate transport system permease protein